MKPDDPKVILGGEVLVCEGMETMNGIERLCLEGTNLLLLEMPFMKWSRGVVETTENLCMREDIKVVVAHADRYPISSIKWFIDNGIRLQLNIDAFRGFFRRKTYSGWAKKGYAQFLGSDIHHATRNPYENWNKYNSLFNIEFKG